MSDEQIFNYMRCNDFNQQINLNEYQVIEKIGKGQFSTVYKVKNKKTNSKYAMKIIEKSSESQKETQLKQIRREIDNLLKCHSSKKNGVVFLIGYTENPDQYILIFELCDTNLEKYINETYPNKKMPLEIIKSLFIELNEGFRNLYEKNIIHRDIKINNILINYRFGDKNDIIPLLADFGISRENSLENPMTASISWALLSAPEILENGKDYSFSSDLWSIGVLLYKLAFGKYPFEGEGLIQIYNNIMNNNKKLEKSGNEDFDDLIRRLLNKKKEKRITYAQYFNHSFFKYNEPKSIMDFNQLYHFDISSYNKRIYINNYINGNQLLNDISNVEFVNLKELHLENCNINNLTPLQSENFKNLLLLNLQYNKISNLQPLLKIKFIWIKEIHLGFNNISNIDVLQNIPFKQIKIIGLLGNKYLSPDYKNKIIKSILSK